MIAQEIDIQNYTGDVDPTKLVPYIGKSFEETEEFKEITDLLKRWQYRTALKKLDSYIEEGICRTDSLLLKGEVLAMYELPEAAIEVFEKILRTEPDNIYALSMILVQLTTARRTQVEIDYYYGRLKEVAPAFSEKFREIMDFIEHHKTDYSYQKIESPLDVICVCGHYLNSDGTMPERLSERLNTTIDLAYKYPNADILLSGGAVQSCYSEAVEMKKFLLSAGIAAERLVALDTAKDTVGNVMEFMSCILKEKYHDICVVSSLEHLPRVWMTLYSALKDQGIEANVYGAAPETTLDPVKFEADVCFSYQTVLRMTGFFSKNDIQNQLRKL